METILLYITIAVALILPHMRARKHILYANIVLVSLYAVIMGMQGVAIGLLIYVIAASSSIMQLMIPEERNIWGITSYQLRISSACILVFFGSIILYSSPLDCIAIAGFAVARFAETRENLLQIKQGYLLSSSLFLVFAALSGVWAVALAQMGLVISLLAAVTMGMIQMRQMQTIAQAAE